MFGLSVDALRKIREAFAGFPQIEKVVIYGSRAKGNHRKGSDIDITLIGKNLTLENTIYPLTSALDDLYLPYTFDISIFNQLDEPEFIDHILRVGKTFYERENGEMDDWMNVQLGDLCDILDRVREPITKRDRVPGPYPYYGATGILDYVEGYLFDEPLVLVGEDGAKWESGENSAFGVSGKFWVNNHAHVLRPNRGVVLDAWLIYFLNHLDLTPYITGLTVPKLNQDKLKKITIILPSLFEQKQIVATLDKTFTAIETAITNTKQNLANARELFYSALNRYLSASTENSSSSVRGKWERVTLREICDVVNGGTPKTKTSEYWDGPHAWITPAEMGNLGSPFVRTTRRTLTDKGLEKCPASILPKYSVVLSSRAPIGHLVINEVPMATNQGCRGLVPHSQLHYKFLYYFMRANVRLLNELGTGTTFKELSATKLKSVSICLPPLDEQKQIVAVLDELSKKKQHLSRIYESKISTLSELKQSILHKAFAGKLVDYVGVTDR